ncbi:hypothetical protein SD37_11585 [Amycolatopsis orientalis]|uniref:Uncharacterized protein n=1 Tax=Amycolatopsis orientalis TaxID=31958 RepID=A0A193BVM3_AMYOR|nr:hypothetical protein [Amycolatopsis orientalis]ANN16219.1 hypothetical protein SD37_11585 [Amycolatopsis orientalis]
MTDQIETAGARDAVIDLAARVVHEVVSKELGLTRGYEPAVTDVVAARELARRGLLVPVELWDDRAREATPLLRHAAALAARSGKTRTSLWLTACATLPPAEWPPAPAYKGPVVPAAKHEQVTAMVAETVRILREAGAIYGEGLPARVRNLIAERDELRTRVEELTDFAGEQANARRESDRIRNAAAREAADLRDERDTAVAQLAEKAEYAGEKAREGDVLSLQVAELTAERDQLQARIDAAKLTWAAAAAIADVGAAENPARWETGKAAIQDFGRALQIDQPAEPTPDGRCPNTPPCEHPAMIHDVSGDPEDPKPMCCADGCACGQPTPPSVVDSGEEVASQPFRSGGQIFPPGGRRDDTVAFRLPPPAPFVPAADAFPEVIDG